MIILSKHQIVEGINRKENKARSWVYDKYAKAIFGFIMHLTKESPDAEDLTSETFLKLFESNKQFEDLKQIRDSVFLIALNLCQDKLRRQELVKTKSPEISMQLRSYEDREIRSAEYISSLWTLVDDAIEDLPRQCRQVYVLHYTEHMTNGEIAKRLGLSLSTVSNHKTKAVEILKMSVQKKGPQNMFFLNFIL